MSDSFDKELSKRRLDSIKGAITAMFGDTKISKAQCKANLRAIIEECELRIEALHDDTGSEEDNG